MLERRLKEDDRLKERRMTGCKRGILQNLGEKDRRILARRMAKYCQEDERILNKNANEFRTGG